VIREEWFDLGTPPEDRWENTLEGKQAAEQHEQQLEFRRLHEAWKARKATPSDAE